jgi:hypothetical protein
MSTTGERTFSTTGRNVVAPKTTLIPPGNYTLKVGSDASIGQSDKPGSVPYINVSFEVEGTSTAEGGKNRRVFHRFFIGLKEGKDGVVNLDRENGLVAFAQALNTQLEGIEIVSRDDEGTATEYLNPRQLVEWLKGYAGAEVKGRVKTEKGTGGYQDKSVVGKFLATE